MLEISSIYNYKVFQKTICLIAMLLFLCITGYAQTQPSDTIRVDIEDADYMKGFSDSLRLLVGDVFLSQLDEQLIFLCDSASIFDNSKSFNAYKDVHLQQSDSINIYADIMKYRTLDRKAYLYRNVYLTDGTADIYADTLIYDVANRQAYLIPRVFISVDSTTIYADSLAYNTKNKQADLFGNVILTDGNMTIKSDEMDYNLNTEIGHYRTGGELTNNNTILESKEATYLGKKSEVFFNNDVVYKDSTYILLTEKLHYNLKSEIAIFTGESTITNDGNTIVCQQGIYDAKTKKVSVEKDAIIQQENNILKADSLAFDNETGLGYAVGNVYWEDTLQQISIKGDYMEFEDSSNYVLATNRPLMTQIIEEENKLNDTLYMMADTLLTQELTDSIRSFEAIQEVMVYKKDFQAICEYLYYDEKDSIFTYYGNPILWLENTQLSADTIILEIRNNNPYKFSLLGNSYMGLLVQNRIYDQIKGERIYGYFKDNDLKNVDVQQNAESVYFVQDESETAFIGINQSSANNMYITIDSNKVQRINYTEKANAKFLTMDSIDPYSIGIKGFSWKEELRPKSVEDLINSTKKDSISTQKSEVELTDSLKTSNVDATTSLNEKTPTKRSFGGIKAIRDKRTNKEGNKPLEKPESAPKKRESNAIIIKAK